MQKLRGVKKLMGNKTRNNASYKREITSARCEIEPSCVLRFSVKNSCNFVTALNEKYPLMELLRSFLPSFFFSFLFIHIYAIILRFSRFFIFKILDSSTFVGTKVQVISDLKKRDSILRVK